MCRRCRRVSRAGHVAATGPGRNTQEVLDGGKIFVSLGRSGGHCRLQRIAHPPAQARHIPRDKFPPAHRGKIRPQRHDDLGPATDGTPGRGRPASRAGPLLFLTADAQLHPILTWARPGETRGETRDGYLFIRRVTGRMSRPQQAGARP